MRTPNNITSTAKKLNGTAKAHNAGYHTRNFANKPTNTPAANAKPKYNTNPTYPIKKAVSHVDFRALLLSGNNVDYMFFDDDYNLEMDVNETVILVASNGIFEVILTPIGMFNIKLADMSLPLPELKKFDPTYLWSIPKPNISLLYELFALNKAVFNKYASEVFAPIVFNTITKKYEIVVPEQVVSGAHVTYDKVTYPKNIMQVIDHHSHANMNAFFSGTDDADDKQVRFKISIVIGKNNTANPEVKARLTINGNFVDVDIYSLFSNGDNNINKLLNNVSKDVGYNRYNGHSGHSDHGYDLTRKNHQSAKNIAKYMSAHSALDNTADDDLLSSIYDDVPDVDHLIDLELDKWGIFEADSDEEIKAIIAKYKTEVGLADDAIDQFIIAASEFLN